MKKVLLVLIVFLMGPQLSWGAAGDREVEIGYTRVPAYPPYQGEVRVLSRDSGAVVQTLLYSKWMKWVVAAIRKKELKGWPPDREGAAESRRYLDELERAYQSVRERAERRPKGERDDHLQLGIEFFLEGDRGYVAFFEPSLTRGEGGRLVLHGKELLTKVPFSRGYVQRNLQLIVEDSFRVKAEEARQLLKKAGGE